MALVACLDCSRSRGRSCWRHENAITVAGLQLADALGEPADLLLIAVPAGEGAALVESLTGARARVAGSRPVADDIEVDVGLWCVECQSPMRAPAPDGRCGFCTEEFAHVGGPS